MIAGAKYRTVIEQLCPRRIAEPGVQLPELGRVTKWAVSFDATESIVISELSVLKSEIDAETTDPTKVAPILIGLCR